MKLNKLALAIALVSSASAMANNTNITQNGNASGVSVALSAATNSNINVNQEWASNEDSVTIRQTGDGNSADTYQNNSFQSVIIIDQNGNGNVANARTIGTLNVVDIIQVGDGNSFNGGVDQGPDEASAISQNSAITVNQNGSNLGVDIWEMSGSNNSYNILQSGDNNYVNTSMYFQERDSDDPFLDGVDGNTVFISQGGTNNSYTSNIRGSDNQINVDQTGDSNFYDIHMQTSNTLQTVTITGNNNDTRGWIDGANATVDLVLGGDNNGNFIASYDAGADGVLIDVVQTGSFGGIGTDIGGQFNSVTIDQGGFSNFANLNMGGDNNTLIVSQLGSNATVNTNIFGTGNFASITTN